MSAIIDMDDPLAAAEPKRDTPPKSVGSGQDAPAAEPKRRGRKAGDAQLKLELKEIESKLTELLQAPAIPMDAAGDTWPARHIENRAPALAHAIAETARNNTQLREKLLQILRVGDGANLAIAALAYLAPVALYYGILPVPPPLRAQLPVPTRQQAREPSITRRMREDAAEQEAEIAREETLRSQGGTSGDPNGTAGAQRAPRQAQARTPPAI